MRYGHKKSQFLYQKLGKDLGYIVKKTYLSKLHTDGVWLIRHPLNMTEEIPIVATEVIVSESIKVIRGSIRTLEEVSPAIAVIIVNEGEIASKLINMGVSKEEIAKRIDKIKKFIAGETEKSCQRFEIWTEKKLSYWIELRSI